MARHWTTSYGARIPAEIDADAYLSVLEMLESAMTRYADKPAFRCFGQTLTYADVDRLSRDFAAWLQGKIGIKKGDRVAVMLPNIPAFPLAMLGIIRAGAIQINDCYVDERGVTYAVDRMTGGLYTLESNF